MAEQPQTPEPVKIASLQMENVKRVEAVEVELSESGVEVIGGRNNQGKTSILDGICWALGGDRFRPSSPDNENTGGNANVRVELSNGLVAQRKGKRGALWVTDPDGKKAGQQILNDIIEMFALNLPRFLRSDDKKKAQTLLQIIGVEEELQKIEEEEKRLYDERKNVGRDLEKAEGHYEELPFYDDAPDTLKTTSELVQRRKEAQDHNASYDRLQEKFEACKQDIESEKKEQTRCEDRIAELKKEIERLEGEVSQHKSTIQEKERQKSELAEQIENFEYADTTEIDQELEDIEAINDKVRANQQKAEAKRKAEKLREEYEEYTRSVNQQRERKMELLQGADMPLPALTVEGYELYYQGKAWDCMSSSDQLKVATSIVQKLNPKCGFILLDQLEKLDVETLREFSEWAKERDLQIIGTRVSTGDECSVVLEEGHIKEQKAKTEPAQDESPL